MPYEFLAIIVKVMVPQLQKSYQNSSWHPLQ
jgi:hypothetical protein